MPYLVEITSIIVNCFLFYFFRRTGMEPYGQSGFITEGKTQA